MRAVLKPMNDTTTIIAEETLADLSSLSRPHTPDLEMATRRHRMVTAWSLSSRVGSVGPFGSGIGGSAAGGMGVNLCVDQLRTNNAGISRAFKETMFSLSPERGTASAASRCRARGLKRTSKGYRAQ